MCTHQTLTEVDERWTHPMLNTLTWRELSSCRCCGGPVKVDEYDWHYFGWLGEDGMQTGKWLRFAKPKSCTRCTEVGSE